MSLPLLGSIPQMARFQIFLEMVQLGLHPVRARHFRFDVLKPRASHLDTRDLCGAFTAMTAWLPRTYPL